MERVTGTKVISVTLSVDPPEGVGIYTSKPGSIGRISPGLEGRETPALLGFPDVRRKASVIPSPV